VWLICNGSIGRGKNKLLIRGIDGAEWVFCPLMGSIKTDRISTDRCQRCRNFIGFEQIRVQQAHVTGRMFHFRAHALRGSFHVRRSLGRSKHTNPYAMPVPSIRSLIRPREPLIDIFQDEEYITVLVELPGVDEKDIDIKADEKTLTISAENATKKYLEIVKLPTYISKDPAKFTYRNNILQIKLKKLCDPKQD